MNLLAIDFDGVIMKAGAGMASRSRLADQPPVDGAIAGVRALAVEWPIVIFSARAVTDRGLVQIWQWLRRHGLADAVIDVTATKPMATAYIDDRAYRFDGWPGVLETFTDQCPEA